MNQRTERLGAEIHAALSEIIARGAIRAGRERDEALVASNRRPRTGELSRAGDAVRGAGGDTGRQAGREARGQAGAVATGTGREAGGFSGAGWSGALAGDMQAVAASGQKPSEINVDIDDEGRTVGLF